MNPAALLGSSRSASLEKGSCAADCLGSNVAPSCPQAHLVMAVVRCHRLNSADIAAMILRGLSRLNSALEKARGSMGAQEMLENEVY
jgi:hypothetical protein